MNTKISTVLLVDDDESTNFLHRRIIEKTGLAERVVIKETGLQALEYLRSMENGVHPQPELILLDINMPVMNGWEFLKEYRQMDAEQQGKIVVVMLTTSINPDDQAKANALGMISDFKNKPLTQAMFTEMVRGYFPERFESPVV